MLISVADRDKDAVLEVARKFSKLGFNIKATKGTHLFLKENGIDSEVIKKLNEGQRL